MADDNGIDPNVIAQILSRNGDWATEATARDLLRALQDYSKYEKALEQAAKKVEQSAENIAEATDHLGDTTKKSAKKAARSQNDAGRRTARSFNNLINRFNQTERPLSAMVDLFGDAGSGFGKLSDKLQKIGDGGAGWQKMLGGVTKYLGPIAEMGMAYAGFVAAKVEQFAEAQKTLIDAGAIYMEGGLQGFEALRTRTYDAGISYQDLANIVKEYGIGVTTLSNGVSGGTDKFVDYFTAMNDTANKFGDFGMQSKEMATAYAEYIEVQRVTGAINKNTQNAQEKLNKGFTQLMLETTAVAALTGENRTELLKGQMAALRDPQLAGTAAILRKEGRETQAKFVEEFAKARGVIGKHLGSKANEALDAMQLEMMTAARSGQPINFANTMDAQTLTAMRTLMPGFVEQLQDRFNAGENIENLQQYMRTSFMNISQKADFTAAAAQDGLFQTMTDMMNGGLALKQAQGNLTNATKEDMDQAKDEAGKQLSASGEIVKNFNELTEGFYKAQDAFTMDLEMASDTMGFFGKTLKNGADVLQGISKSARRDPHAFTMSEFGEMGSDSNSPPGRASGGPVTGGKPYVVGEEGPEIIVPDGNAEVLNNDYTNELMKYVSDVTSGANPYYDKMRNLQDLYQSEGFDTVGGPATKQHRADRNTLMYLSQFNNADYDTIKEELINKQSEYDQYQNQLTILLKEKRKNRKSGEESFLKTEAFDKLKWHKKQLTNDIRHLTGMMSAAPLPGDVFDNTKGDFATTKSEAAEAKGTAMVWASKGESRQPLVETMISTNQMWKDKEARLEQIARNMAKSAGADYDTLIKPLKSVTPENSVFKNKFRKKRENETSVVGTSSKDRFRFGQNDGYTPKTFSTGKIAMPATNQNKKEGLTGLSNSVTLFKEFEQLISNAKDNYVIKRAQENLDA